ncbi:hypothetical protein ACJ73_03199 [Blastomyces percursus]|uniref:Uncharacterized protein n=1 Tax=Blastomyces percursus TaxID=1658174 RepID=A0A1J9QA78_9EURO|nr:hypothetical protein ACJ73_03199 [Blastomyces percursus]
MNLSSQTTGPEIPWSPASPPIHPPPECVNQMRRELGIGYGNVSTTITVLLLPALLADTSWTLSTSADPNYPIFSNATKLPGSAVGPPESVELDVSSTSIRNLKSLENGECQIIGSPPDLVNSPGWGDYSRVFDSDCSGPQNRRRNDKLCAGMDFWELLEVLPTLSADDIREFWHPAIVQQAKRIDRRRLKLRDEARVDSANVHEYHELYTMAGLETVKQHCEEQLNAKETEISELRQLHEHRLNMLCDFISTRSGPELAQSTDPAPSVSRPDILINTNQQRPHKPFSPNKEHNKPTQAQSQFRSGSDTSELPTNLPRTPQT